MHFYSIGYGELRQLPISAFWVLSRNVDRIRAEEDQRFFRSICTAIGGKPQEFMEALEKEKGVVVQAAEVEGSGGLDREGMEKLKGLFRRRR